MNDNKDETGLEIAIIGMAGRFPGAADVEQFWENLKNGVESITFFSDEELLKTGVDQGLLMNPGYVKCGGGKLEDIEYFDPSFFNYSQAEAELMDPQLRLFHEYAYHALEHAGYNSISYEGLIGVYAGASFNLYWEALALFSGKIENLGGFASGLLIDRDYLSTRVSYNLDLKGPSVVVKTACSTSLVAVHMACQAILNGECDMALAGGVTVCKLRNSGYMYQEDMVFSPDGHCRAFDEHARGMISGDGIGIILLKRLEEAISDRDYIHAVIKGTAINNDGKNKTGYTAPGIDGQCNVICDALEIASVDPDTITYVETHGTGTPIGDPIEIEALKMAFSSSKKHYCAIGSVKSNIGHLDAAAGIASLIKVVMALEHRLIPPSLHYEKANSRLNLTGSPFFVNHQPMEWKRADHPLRAGVSSFGIGGTNAHVILEDFQPLPEARENPPIYNRHLVLLSAKSEATLDKMSENLAEYFKKTGDINLADASYTLQIGRRSFPYRQISMFDTVKNAVNGLHGEAKQVRRAYAKEEKKCIVFMFPGLGHHYVNMGRDLFETEPRFREEMTRCFDILRPLLGYDLKEVLYPGNTFTPTAISVENPMPPELGRFEIAQAAVFILEYSLSQLLISWGIKPDAMIGYSLGEYTAACLSGVFSLEDALHILSLRSRLIEETGPGAMLSVPLPLEQLLPLLAEFKGDTPGNGYALSPAIDNGPSCVVSGPIDQVAAFETVLKRKKYICMPVYASRALHSSLMEPILGRFKEKLSRYRFNQPTIPYISNVTGNWITTGDAAEAAYWARHLHTTVRFSQGVNELLKQPHPIFLEVGPSYDLSVLIRHFKKDGTQPTAINLIKHPQSDMPDTSYLLSKIGQLWLAGVSIDWTTFYRGQARYRLPLPGYPFEKHRCWLKGDPWTDLTRLPAAPISTGKRSDIAAWFYIPTWKRSTAVLTPGKDTPWPEKSCWLIFCDSAGLGDRLTRQLKDQGQETIIVKTGTAFTKINANEFAIDPRQPGDYHLLCGEFEKDNIIPTHIIHLWSVSASMPDRENSVADILDYGFYSLLFWMQASGKAGLLGQIKMTVVSDHLWNVIGDEKIVPAKATIPGALSVFPREYPNLKCRSVDIVFPPTNGADPETSARQILAEFAVDAAEPIVAYRGNHRWIQVFDNVPLREPETMSTRLRKEGVYLITGGLGGIGLVLAEHLARTCKARLVLTGRSPFPGRERWDEWLSSHEAEDQVSLKIKKLVRIEEQGAQVTICTADVTSQEQMKNVILHAKEKYGRIHGVIHSAGLPDGGVIPLREKKTTNHTLAAKIQGTLVLDRLLEGEEIDFFVLCSSLSAIIGPLGQVGYCGANAFQDAYAHACSTGIPGLDKRSVLSIDWDHWLEVGMGAQMVKRLVEKENINDSDILLAHGILSSEGASVFNRLLDYDYPQVIVSTRDLNLLLKPAEIPPATDTPTSTSFENDTESTVPVKTVLKRPELSTDYVSPKTGFEKILAGILQEFLGVDRVGIDDNFFEFGITSLALIQINQLVRQKINKDIPLAILFGYPTLRLLGRYLDNLEKPGKFSPPVETETITEEKLNKAGDLLHRSIHLARSHLKENENDRN